MKYCIVVPDGAADYAVPKLDDRTPLEAARTPNMDRAAREGLLGLTDHIPHRMSPGSAVAMMSMVGYDPAVHYTGRGPLEAADLGIRMKPGEWAIRCNLVTAADGVLVDFTAGHISTQEADLLIQALNKVLGSGDVRFHTGVSYRHIMMYRGTESPAAETLAPHDHVGEKLRDLMPRGEGSELLVRLMERSPEALEGHDVNHVRTDLGKNPANMIWLWGQGRMPTLEPFQERFGIRGAVISAVNLVRGIGRLVGWEVIDVPGATGYSDTDYAAKGRYAIEALNRVDLVLVHIEAPDEMSHEQDLKAKIRAIESIDADIVGPLMALRDAGEDIRVLIVPDHVTSVADGKHKTGPVPFAMWGTGIEAASGRPYDELHASGTEIDIADGHELMNELIGKW
jgi:2,3-bisphosphoglycerate-independent phosphoglycerate mutase